MVLSCHCMETMAGPKYSRRETVKSKNTLGFTFTPPTARRGATRSTRCVHHVQGKADSASRLLPLPSSRVRAQQRTSGSPVRRRRARQRGGRTPDGGGPSPHAHARPDQKQTERKPMRKEACGRQRPAEPVTAAGPDRVSSGLECNPGTSLPDYHSRSRRQLGSAPGPSASRPLVRADRRSRALSTQCHLRACLAGLWLL